MKKSPLNGFTGKSLRLKFGLQKLKKKEMWAFFNEGADVPNSGLFQRFFISSDSNKYWSFYFTGLFALLHSLSSPFNKNNMVALDKQGKT